MIVVLAGRHDAAARLLVTRSANRGLSLLTCDDLSRAGWVHDLADASCGRAVIDGRVVPTTEISGVVTALRLIGERELPRVRIEDRPYVATEMTAFLMSWLTSLAVPVVNRPTPLCLLGPAWRQEQWVAQAARLGAPVRPAVRRVAIGEAREEHRIARTVTVVGERCFGTGDTRWAQALASAAGVAALRVFFSAADEVMGADPAIDLGADDIGEALLDHMQSAPRSRLASTAS